MITYESLPKERDVCVARNVYSTYQEDSFDIRYYPNGIKADSGRHIATLYPAYTQIESITPEYIPYKLFGVHTRIRRLTVESNISTPHTSEWAIKNSNGKRRVAYGRPPIILANDNIYALDTALTRLINHKKKYEIDKTIRSVRQMLITREKLGAFRNVRKDELTERYRVINAIATRNTHKVYDVLRNVSPHSLESFNPLLYMVLPWKTEIYLSRSEDIVYCWHIAYDRMIRYKRPHFYEYMNAITFLPIQPPTLEEILRVK